VRAQASYTIETNGTKKYVTEIHKGATILDILQVQSAVHWHEKIDQRELTEQRTLTWLVDADRVTDRHYLSPRYLDSPSLELFYSALARHCLHYVLGHLDDPALSDAVRKLYDIQIVSGPGKMRFAQDIEAAKSWVTLEASGALDSRFVREIRNSVGVYA
jgi:phage gp36-like protein